MKKRIIPLLVIALLIGGAFFGYTMYQNYMYQDWTGKPYAEIAAYQAEHPKVTISYTVTIEGGSMPKEIYNDTTSVVLETPAQIGSLVAHADYLQALTSIDLGEIPMRAEEVDSLKAAFPNAEVLCKYVSVLGTNYTLGAEHVDLAAMTSSDLDNVIAELKYLTNLKTINLLDANGNAKLSLDDAVKLYTAYPDVEYTYAVTLFGQRLTTDMESVEYAMASIGDAGLAEFEKLFPMMHKLTYFKLDTCETTNEAMAALREKYKDDFKVVWRVYFGSQHNMFTDTYKLWASYALWDKHMDDLKYFNEVKYLDFGHSYFTNLDWMENMTELETCILAIGRLTDISGIVNCKKITYLEIFDNQALDDEDMQYLKELPNIKYLNIGNIKKMRDLSFTDNMPLRRLWCTCWKGTDEEAERVRQRHPNADILFLFDGDTVSYGWRYTPESGYQEKTPEYELISAQFNYAIYDFSRYPKGYLREEITYESLGLTPS